MRDRPNKSSNPDRRRKHKPTVSIIGAGRLGTTLGRALAEAGYRIEAVAASKRASAMRAARLIEPQPTSLGASAFASLPQSDLLLITTPDDVIGSVAAEIAGVPGAGEASRRSRGRKQIALHASGALSSEVLAPLRQAGFAVGSMHPLVSISDRGADAGAGVFQGAFFCLEGQAVAVRMARALVRDLDGQSFSVKPVHKPLYHAAAVMASGHVTALFDVAAEMLVHCGLSPQRARAVLQPLLQSAVTNLARYSPAQALTGPFARGDAATVLRHLEAIRSQGLSEAEAAYLLLGNRSLRLTAKGGIDDKAL